MNQTFTSKSHIPKMLSAFFALSSILIPYISRAGCPKYLLAAFCLTIAIITLRVPPKKIEVDEVGIKERQHGSSRLGLISRIYQSDTECEWKWIQSVATRRLNVGFLTVLYLFEDVSNKPKYRVTIESSIFSDYLSILRIIKDRATQAHFDETTEMILNDKMDIRTVRPIYWMLFFIITVSVVLYIFTMGKG